jgi:membrane protease YdiL (CAAX protease family)
VSISPIPLPTPPERPPSQEGLSPAGLKQLFIWALVAGFMPCFGLPLVWGGALFAWRASGGPEHRRWKRRLVTLAIVDTLVAAAALHLGMVAMKKGEGLAPAPSGPQRMVGIIHDPKHPGPGIRLSQVLEGSPAAQGGLRVGDVVHQADGRPVQDFQALREVVRAAPPGAPVRLEVERDGARREVAVVPVEAASLPSAAEGLFEARKQEPPAELAFELRKEWIGAGLAIGALLVLWGLGRKRGADVTPLGVLAGLLAAVLGSTATMLGLASLLGGPTRGGVLVGAFVQTLLVVLAAWGLFRRGAPALEEPGTRGWLHAYFVGLGLLVTLGMRTLFLLAWISQVLSTSPEDVQHPLTGIAQTGPLGPLGWLLLASSAVLLAPLGEELMFRGVLLPWLRGWMGQTAALVLSAGIFASLHAFYGVFVGWVFFLGLLMGWVRLYSGGLRAPILLHATVNGFAMVMLARTLAKG